MKILPTIALLAALTCASVSHAADKPKVSVAFFSWPGYGFWFVAKEKNLAPDLDLELQIIEDPYETYGQMAAGRIDIASSTMEYGPIAVDNDVPIKLVSQTTLSYGTDKLIVAPGIDSAKDLVGKSVAVLEGGLAQIFMGIWLEKNGVAFDDVTYTNVIMDDAVAAMISGKVAGAQFWEPFGSKVLENLDGAKVVATSSEPYWLKTALLADGMYMSDALLTDRPDVAAKALKAYWDAVAYWRANPEEANKIIAEGLKFEVADVESVLGTTGEPQQGGLAIFSLADATAFMGVAEGEPAFGLKNGQIKDVWSLTTEWWKKFGLVKGDPTFEAGVDLAPMKGLADE
jgi:NitT/TauT family transport system substrate-binding protein